LEAVLKNLGGAFDLCLLLPCVDKLKNCRSSEDHKVDGDNTNEEDGDAKVRFSFFWHSLL